jgi:hypothetical protein
LQGSESLLVLIGILAAAIIVFLIDSILLLEGDLSDWLLEYYTVQLNKAAYC